MNLLSCLSSLVRLRLRDGKLRCLARIFLVPALNWKNLAGYSEEIDGPQPR